MDLTLATMPESDFAILHESVLRILEEYGALFEHEEARRLLKRAGNRLDDDGRIHISAEHVQKVLDLVPHDGFSVYGRDESIAARVAVGEMLFRPSTGEPFVWDYSTRSRRPATNEDASDLIRITDALPEYALVNAIVNPEDAPDSKQNLKLFVLSHRHSLKPSDVTVSSAREVEAIARIAAAIRGDGRKLRERPLTIVDIAVVTPLRFTPRDTEAFLAAARHGLPVEILTSPSMSLTSPITIAGSVAVSAAEMIAAICLVYSVQPGLGIVNTARISPLHMRTGSYNYGAPELSMGSVVSAAYCNRLGIPSNLYGFGTAAKEPGLQSSLEKGLGGLLMTLGAPHMVTGSGTLDNSLVTSPEMLVVDHELIRFLKRIRRPIEISREAIAVDDFISAMQTSGSMMAEEHTIRYLHEGELIDCGLGQWTSYDGWVKQSRPNLIDRAHKEVETILAEQNVPDFDQSTKHEIERGLDSYDAS